MSPDSGCRFRAFRRVVAVAMDQLGPLDMALAVEWQALGRPAALGLAMRGYLKVPASRPLLRCQTPCSPVLSHAWQATAFGRRMQAGMASQASFPALYRERRSRSIYRLRTHTKRA